MGWKILAHAVRLVFSHFGEALRLSAVPYLVQFAVIIGGSVLAFGNVVASRGLDDATVVSMVVDGWTVLTILVVGIVAVVTSIWIAVAWHRYVLLDEMPGALLPRFHGDRILAYFGRSLLLGLVAFAIIAVVGTLIGLGLAAASATGTLFAALMMLVLYVVLVVVAYRLSPILPAAAIGRPLSFGEAWAATSGANGTLVGLAVLSVIGVVVLGLPELLFRQLGSPVLSFVWQAITAWIELIVGISIITTLYGHYVEKRPID